MLKQILTLSLLFAPSLGLARTSWVKWSNGDRSCGEVCGRDGLEAILAPKADAAVCAIEHEGEIYPGTLPREGERVCHTRLAGHKAIILGNKQNTQCLCADDGNNRGSDYAWISFKEAHASCRTTCNETAPKYMYPVFGSFTSAWLEVCATAIGEVGFHEGQTKHPCHAGGDSDQFGCLCTQMYTTDLDKTQDP